VTHLPAEGSSERIATSPRALRPRAAAAILSAVLIVAVGLGLANKMGQGYGWDDGAYLASARAMVAGHPLFSEVFSSQPPVFLELLALAFRVFGDSGTTGEWMGALFALACLALVAWIAAEVAGPLAAPVAVLAMLSKIFLGQALAIEAEIPALALSLLALALLTRGGERLSRVAAAGTAFALAVLCKLWTAPYVLPLVFLAAAAPRHGEDGCWRADWDRMRVLRRLAVLGLAGAVVTVLVLARYDFSALYEQVVAMHVQARGLGEGAWGRTGARLLLRYGRDEIVVHLAAAAGAWLLFKRNALAGVWLVVWVAASAGFLLHHRPVFIRHALLVSPPLAVLAAAAFGLLAREARPAVRYAAAAVTTALLLVRPTATLEAGAPVWNILGVTTRMDPAEAEAVRLMGRFSTEGALVVTDDPLQAYLAGRAMPPRLVDISGTRVMSGNLTTEEAIRESESADMIVLWAGSLEKLPGYRDWVKSRYRKVKTWRDSETLREMWVRK
jgi:hypothetical protein